MGRAEQSPSSEMGCACVCFQWKVLGEVQSEGSMTRSGLSSLRRAFTDWALPPFCHPPPSTPLSTLPVLGCQLQMIDRIPTASKESMEPLIKHQHHRNPKEPKNKK